MKIETFKGDYSQIGEQLGKIYSKNGKTFNNIKINQNLYKNQLKIYQKHYPQILEELKAMANAGNFNKDKLIYRYICDELDYFIKQNTTEKSCTIFGIKNKAGVFIGRNYDWTPLAKNYFKIYKFENPKVNSFIAISDMAVFNLPSTKPKFQYYYPDDAINDKGLFVGLTFAFGDSWQYGLSCIHVTKLIAETCETVEDAINFFKKVPTCCPKNYVIGDKFGKMVSIQCNGKNFKVIYPKDDILIQTNHFTDPNLIKGDLVLKTVPNHNTFIRYYEVLQRLNFNKDKFKFADIIKILNDKNTSICQNFKGIETIWSLAIDLQNQKYKLYWNVNGKKQEKILKL